MQPLGKVTALPMAIRLKELEQHSLNIGVRLQHHVLRFAANSQRCGDRPPHVAQVVVEQSTAFEHDLVAPAELHLVEVRILI